jgi:hypothetical protein
MLANNTQEVVALLPRRAMDPFFHRQLLKLLSAAANR